MIATAADQQWPVGRRDGRYVGGYNDRTSRRGNPDRLRHRQTVRERSLATTTAGRRYTAAAATTSREEWEKAAGDSLALSGKEDGRKDGWDGWKKRKR